MSKSKEIIDEAEKSIVSRPSTKGTVVLMGVTIFGVCYVIRTIYDMGRNVSKVTLREVRRNDRIRRREQRRYEKEMKKEQRRREFEQYLYGTPR